jgi:xylulokinase
MTDTVLGIDAGTSGCRVAAYDPALREVAAATARYQVSLPGPGRAEIDADEVWAAVAGCLRTVNEQLDRSPQALAIAVQGETVLPAGADGEALAMAPISTDARAVAETAAITDAVGARRLRVITGQRPHPMFSIGKIAWTRRIPGLWQRAARFHCLGDFLALRMGVPPAIDYTMAARTMAFDCHQQAWSAEILDAAGVPEMLMPTAVPVGAELGRLLPAIAGSLGFAQPPVLVAGAHDQACALLGAGATEPGQAAVSLGTSECLTVNVDGWPESLTETSFPAYRPWPSDRWMVLAGIPSGGATLDWLAGMIAGPGEDHGLGQLMGLLPAEPAHVLALPHFAGSGTAENDPVSRGAFIGLSHSTSAGELFRAVLEASGFEMARSVAALAAAGIVISELRASGGGTAATAPVQIRSTAAGLPLNVVPGHATARGAAMIAGAATGFYPSLTVAGASVRPASSVRLDPEAQRWYQRQRKRYSLLYPALRPVYHFPTGDDADEPCGQPCGHSHQAGDR